METTHSEQLISYITAAGENDNIDAKAAMAWDGADNSAKLTKQIIGFANSRDGGVLVIGKEEVQPGKFHLSGVSSDQADSFDQTKVTTWINNHCDPSVRVQVCRQGHDGKEFIVIVVTEFDEIPILCIRQFPPNGSKDLILRKGTLSFGMKMQKLR